MEPVDVTEGHINGLILRQYKDLISGIWADLGCGDLRYTKILAKYVDYVYAIDIREPDERPSIQSNITFARRDIRRTGFDDNSLDGIASFHTLEHVKGCCLDDVPKEMRRVLKTGGYVIVSVPFKRAYYMEGHVNFFDVGLLKGLFERAGFSTLECYQDRRIDDRGKKHNCVTGVFRK